MKTLLLSILLSISSFLIATATATAQEENKNPHHEKTNDPKAQPPALQQIIEENAEAHRKIVETQQDAAAQAAALEADGQPGPAAEVRQRACEKMRSTVEELHRSTEAKMKHWHKEGTCPVCQQNETDAPSSPSERDREADHADHRQTEDDGPRPGVKRRLHHVEESMRHLRAAGLHDLAQKLEDLAHSLRSATAPSPRPQPAKRTRPQDDIQALRQEIEALRQSVQSLIDKENRHH